MELFDENGLDSPRVLNIRTKTIEISLTPLFQQISSLINHQSPRRSSSGTVIDITSISSSVRNAVEKFISAGQKVAEEYPTIKPALLAACQQAKSASSEVLEHSQKRENSSLIGPSRKLVTAMHQVLVLADSVIVSEITSVKEKVIGKLDYLTKVTNFTDFLDNFTSFGTDMVEFGKLSGERQMDMKRELDAAKMACLRGFLEKSTAIYLTACKICLRHPASDVARNIRNTVVTLMKHGLEEIVDIVNYAPSAQTDDHEKILTKFLQTFNESLEMCVILSSDITSVQKAEEAFAVVDEYVHEFTDSAYTPHEHRELIILMCEKCKQEVDRLEANQSMDDSFMLEATANEIQASLKSLRKSLIEQTVNSGAELFGNSVDTGLLFALKSAAQRGEEDMMQNIASQIRDHVEQIQEVSKQMQHVAPSDSFYVRVKYTSSYLLSLTELLIDSAEVYCLHGMSRVAAEGHTAMSDSWVMLIGELAAASEELQDFLYQP